jgi:import inner membrane translocase subunit TIM22
MGAAFGLFMSSFEYAGPVMNEDLVKQTTKQQIKHAFKDMGTRSLSMAKNFGTVGLIYSGSECCIESVSYCLDGIDRLGNSFFIFWGIVSCKE